MFVDFDVREQQGIDFFTGGSVIMNYGLIFSPYFHSYFKKVKLNLLSDTNMQVFTSQDVNWCDVDYCDVFIICLDSYSDGTHSLQRIH